MTRARYSCLATTLVLAAALTAKVNAEPAAAAKAKDAAPPAQPKLEPKAIELLQAMSARLAAARTMTFTAIATYESPSRLGPALAYTTRSEVSLQRPDKLRVITPGDGPPFQFYVDGTTVTGYSPAQNLVATAETQPTIDAALKAAYDKADIYFPFTDVVVADPYGDISKDLQIAFYIGQSQVVGGTTTDMIAAATDGVFAQIWIGASDKLPRRVRAVYRDDPSKLRQELEFTDWHLDVDLPADTFTPAAATATAKHIEFKAPAPQAPAGAPAAKKAGSKKK